MLFIASIWIVGRDHYGLALLISHVIASNAAFVLHKKVVFSQSKSSLSTYIRFHISQIVTLTLNFLFLTTLVELGSFPAIESQVVCAVAVAVTSYFLLKGAVFNEILDGNQNAEHSA